MPKVNELETEKYVRAYGLGKSHQSDTIFPFTSKNGHLIRYGDVVSTHTIVYYDKISPRATHYAVYIAPVIMLNPSPRKVQRVVPQYYLRSPKTVNEVCTNNTAPHGKMRIQYAYVPTHYAAVPIARFSVNLLLDFRRREDRARSWK